MIRAQLQSSSANSTAQNAAFQAMTPLFDSELRVHSGRSDCRMLDGLPSRRKTFVRKILGARKSRDARDHRFSGLAGDVGARQPFAEAATAVAAR